MAQSDGSLEDLIPLLDKNYHPGMGSRTYESPEASIPDSISGNYANINQLRERLRVLKSIIASLKTDMDTELQRFIMPITTKDADTELREAHRTTWPATVSSPPQNIAYQYYQVLAGVDSVSARYIRQRFEEATRGVTGDTTLDLFNILIIFENESNLVEQFLNQYIGNVDDSSEYRTLELFQDWVESALYDIQSVKNLFENKDSPASLPTQEIEGLEPTEASQSQALFQFKLNSLNQEIVSLFTGLKRDFADYAELFFQSHLGPAMEMRLGATRHIYPKDGIVGEEIRQAKGAVESHFQYLLADQMRRVNIFETKVRQILKVIYMRNSYRNYIQQLTDKGTLLAQGAPGTLAVGAADLSQIELAKKEINTQSTSLGSEHSQLSGVDDPNAHPQYLLSKGGTVTGDIKVDKDVKIGGINLSTHAHSGADGSAKISGKDILPGTLQIGTVNKDDKPILPNQLTILAESARSLSAEITVLDVKIGWFGDSEDSFEVQISPVT